MKQSLILIATILLFGCNRSEEPYIFLSNTSFGLGSAGVTRSITVESNYPWSSSVEILSGGQSWLTFTPQNAESGKTTVWITARANNSGNNRRAILSFTAGNKTASLTVFQQTSQPEGYYRDGEVVKLQTATAATGRGIDLVFMGDGYTMSDMSKTGGGKYDTDIRASVEHFFSTFPFSVNRGRFNVWMVAAISNQSGISVQNPATTVDTKFKSVWEGGQSTGVDCDETTVQNYASFAANQAGKGLSELTVVMPINANITAGTCIMQFDGFSISMCPVGPLFKNIVVHEAGGHGFAKLGDEYVYNETPIPADIIEYVQSAKTNYGFYANLDFYSNIAQTSWSGFAGNPKYSMVSTFMGGYTYRQNIFRPEQNSCMNDGVLYFNAPSRWAMIKRMYELEGTPYTFAQFLVDEVVPAYPATRSGFDVPGPYPNSAPPIVVMPEGRIASGLGAGGW